MKQKQIYSYREQICGCCGGRMIGSSGLADINHYM